MFKFVVVVEFLGFSLSSLRNIEPCLKPSFDSLSVATDSLAFLNQYINNNSSDGRGRLFKFDNQ